MRKRHTAAFTLIELLITALIGTVLGGIIYLVASEGLTSFARNASLNRGYTDARSAIDQITSSLLSAGHAPTFLDVNGAITTATQAEGVRFYRVSSLSTYEIPSGKTSDTTLTVNYTPVQMNSAGANSIGAGDLLTIPVLGFQGTVASVAVTPGNSNVSLAKVTFTSAVTTIASGCVPVPSSTLNLAYQATTPPTYYTALVYRQVAFIAVPNAVGGGAQLRYYPQAMSTGNGQACGNLAAFNNATAFSNAKNYSVLANISTTVSDTSLVPLKPFLNPDASDVLQIALCAEGPDYNNRGLNTSNTYSMMRSSMGSRCPVLLRTMSVPF